MCLTKNHNMTNLVLLWFFHVYKNLTGNCNYFKNKEILSTCCKTDVYRCTKNTFRGCLFKDFIKQLYLVPNRE